jgi:mycothiol synthase
MQIRAATLDDVERLAAFMGRCTLAHQGVRRASAEMRQRLTRPGTDPSLDTWLVEAGGEFAGFGQVWPDEEAVVCYVRVDPEHTARGLASTLLERASARAHELAPEPALHATSWPKDESAAPLLEGNGFKPIRYLSLMTIDLVQPPESPSWPSEIRVRALDESDDLRPIHEAEQAVFPERPQSIEEWLHDYGEFDPTLWFVAEDPHGIAGLALCLPELAEDPDAGYVSELSVRADRRGEGLGLALLRHSFVELHRRGKQRASLHVDVGNLSGALRLYTRAGMRPDPRLVVWERPFSKPPRPGTIRRRGFPVSMAVGRN